MKDILIASITTLVTGALLAVVLQVFPSLYGWDEQIVWNEDEAGRRVYRVRFGRRLPRTKAGKALRRMRPILRSLRLVPRRLGPFDVQFVARVVLGDQRESGVRVERVVSVPITDAWRPAVSGGVNAILHPEACDPGALGPFPPEIHALRRDGSLSLHDLLSVSNTSIRIYAFCYRRYLGTRLVRLKFFRETDLKLGAYHEGFFIPLAHPSAPDPSPVGLRTRATAGLAYRADEAYLLTFRRRRRALANLEHQPPSGEAEVTPGGA